MAVHRAKSAPSRWSYGRTFNRIEKHVTRNRQYYIGVALWWIFVLAMMDFWIIWKLVN